MAVTRLGGTLRPMDIGDRIRAARKAVGWTQPQLAAAIGVNKSAVAQWESPGKSRRGITTENLQKVARVLRIRLADLLEDGPSGEDIIETRDQDEIALL